MYKSKKNIMCHNQKVLIKTGEELSKEGFEIRKDGVYKDTKMYLNESDLQYLGWKMKIEFKDSTYYGNNEYMGFSLSAVNGYEIDMCNIESIMFKYVQK